MKRCPRANCGCWIEDGVRNCPKCGAAIRDANADVTESGFGGGRNPNGDLEDSIENLEAEIFGGASKGGKAIDASGAERLSDAKMSQSKEASDMPDASRDIPSDGLEADGGNDDFSLAYDALVPFCNERQNVLGFKVVPRVGMTNVHLKIRPHFGDCPSSEKWAYELPGRKRHDWQPTFDIGGMPAGDVICEIELGYLVGDHWHDYKGEIKLVVSDRETARIKARQNVGLYNQQHINVTSQHAGDSRANVDGISPEAVEKFVKSLEVCDPMEVANSLSGSGAHRYVGIKLLPLEGLPDGECRSLQFLLSEDVRVVFFSCEKVKVGRPEVLDDGAIGRPHTGIMIEPPSVSADDTEGTRQWIRSSRTDEQLEPYKRISRTHCEFSQSCEGHVTLQDSSSNGTFFTDESSAQCVRIGKDMSMTISSGEIRLGGLPSSISMYARLFNEGGLLLSRRDGPIHYVFLWKPFDLGLISGVYRGHVVKWDAEKGMFFLEYHGMDTALTFGQKIRMSRFAPITVSKAWNK